MPHPLRLALAAAAAAIVVPAAQAPPAADLIVHNARIYTADAARPRAQAIAVRGGRIAVVADDASALALRGSATRVVDAGGAAIVPGLQDAHGHFSGLGENLQTLDVRDTTSFEQVVARVRQRVAATPRGEWILGRGWDQNDWADKAWPTHELLTAVAPEHPVLLSRVDGHASIANARALQLAGITAKTPDPDGGRIMRGAGGEPTGVLIDRAEDLVAARVPGVTAARLDARILLADAEARRLGLTMVHDAGNDAATIAAYRRLAAVGRLKTRLYVMVSGPEFAAWRQLPDTDPAARVVVRSIKVYADGALGSRGAAMLEPYADEPATSGLLTTPPEQVYAQTLAAAKRGFQTGIHAIGDRGNRIAIDTFERVQREVPGARALRPRVEHAQILDAADIPRFAALGIIASMQATHATSDMPWVPARIGVARMREGAYAWQTLVTSGVVLANGSDFPVEEANPMLGFHASITRQDAAGHPAGGWMPEQRLTREQALRSFTWGAAYAAHAETVLGSLEAGKLADFVVLSRDIMRVDPGEIPSTIATMTVVGGEVVHEAKR